MNPELNYTQIQVKQYHPQLMPVIDEEPMTNLDDNQPRTPVRRESIAIHPTCDCSNCCCYFCCGCPALYTPLEMQANKDRLTMCPLTSKVVDPALIDDVITEDPDDMSKSTSNPNPAFCLLTPITLVIDLISLVPRICIVPCS